MLIVIHFLLFHVNIPNFTAGCTEPALSENSKNIIEDKPFQRGAPYSSHQGVKTRKSESVIYIPSSQDETEAETARLEFDECYKVTTELRGSKPPIPCNVASAFCQNNGNISDNIFFTLHKVDVSSFDSEANSKDFTIKRIPVRFGKLEGEGHDVAFDKSSKIEHLSHIKAAEKQNAKATASGTVSWPRYKSVAAGNCMDIASELGPKLSEKYEMLNNFIEINIVSLDVDKIADDVANRLNSDDKLRERCKSLHETVRELINNIFESPRKRLQELPKKLNLIKRPKQVKISVDSLPKDKLDFIIENPKCNASFVDIISSKRFLFLQLCFLAVISIYLMSFYSLKYPFRVL